METFLAKRKLIDISVPMFETLARQAKREGVSLKRYIENLLEKDAAQHRSEMPARITDPRIVGLVGIAKRAVAEAGPDDERLQYILSK